MLLVDDRAGSADLADPLRAKGLEVSVERMESADVAWLGRGVGGAGVNIGVEHKTMPDLVQSIRSGRLVGEQLPKMLGPRGNYDHGWLVAEGAWRINSKTGLLQLLAKRPSRFGAPNWQDARGRMSGAEFLKHLTTLEVIGGLHVHFSQTRQASIHFLVHLYRWWTDKDLDQHTSMVGQHTPHGFIPLSDFRDVLSRFPGISLRTSLAVEGFFRGNLIAAVQANVATWASIPVIDKQGKARRIGSKTAQRIVDFCHGKDYEHA